MRGSADAPYPAITTFLSTRTGLPLIFVGIFCACLVFPPGFRRLSYSRAGRVLPGQPREAGQEGKASFAATDEASIF